MLKNNKGVTLLELLICLVIMGILMMSMFGLFALANKKIAMLNKTIQKANGGTCYASVGMKLSGIPIVCFDNGKADGCDATHTCSYNGGQWYRNSQLCDAGVILKGDCSK